MIIASGAESNSAGPSKNATGPRRATRDDHAAARFMDRGSGWKLDGPGTAAAGVSDDGERIHSGIQSAATTPVSKSRRAPPAIGSAGQRAHAERLLDVLGAEQHGHVARSGNRLDPRVCQLEVARIGALRLAQERGVRLTLPARAIHEA